MSATPAPELFSSLVCTEGNSRNERWAIMRNFPRLLATVLFLSLVFATAAWPQGGQTGAIAGSVKDPSGAVVPGATVKVFNETTGRLERTVSTAADGNYAVTLLTPGSYRLQITAQGFKEFNAVQVPVRLNEATRLDGTLEVGTVQESVTVEATPTLVSTLSATTGQPIDANTLGQLPLPVPNFMFLLALSTGTAGEPPDVRNANRGIVDINVNGGRTTNNSVSLEGINVNDFNLAHFDTIPCPIRAPSRSSRWPRLFMTPRWAARAVAR